MLSLLFYYFSHGQSDWIGRPCAGLPVLHLSLKGKTDDKKHGGTKELLPIVNKLSISIQW